jgi:hypothetical protein
LSKKRKFFSGAAGSRAGAGADERHQLRRRIARPGEAVLRNEFVDARQRLGGNAGAVAQPRHELAVVDRAAAEGGLRHAGAPTEIGDAPQQGAFHEP